MTPVIPIRFDQGVLSLLDQTRLPGEVVRYECRLVDEVHDAICRLVVRGAPAIGIAAAYGVCLARDSDGNLTRQAALDAIDHLATSRPTAVNLFWALDRMKAIVQQTTDDDPLSGRLIREAMRIDADDRRMCREIGLHGAARLGDARSILTHCNAGTLATSLWGTALAPIYQLHQQGRPLHVYADETRPLMQGARLTAWELSQAGIPVTVLTDSMAGSLMRSGRVDAVIVGADRITAAGDVANKIGTYPLAVLAKYHGIPFFVAAPTNTFDLTLVSGDQIPIEQRSGDEVRGVQQTPTVPPQAAVINPAFDVTPAELITAIVTQLGVIERPDQAAVATHLLDQRDNDAAH